MTRTTQLMAVAILLLAPLRPAAAATVTDVFGGRIPCSEQNGVQFCAGSATARVETWDGVPIDANVTIPPASQDGPFPVIVDIHGWAVGKSQQPFVNEAMNGYVVLSYSARGFHNSCGFAAARVPDPTLTNPTACIDAGWVRLADVRYEVRDTQYLTGILVDEGLAIPDKIGATGSSYGGGQSLMLAVLKNRVMMTNGTLVPWTSPLGTPMELAAAAPLITWSDLAYALHPTGRTRDDQTLNPYGARIGVSKNSWVEALYAAGLATGFYAPPATDPNADLTAWRDRINQGEPYDGDALVEHVVEQLTLFHSAYYLDDSVEPAPLFIYNAWTDDLFPADEQLRFVNKTKSLYPNAEIGLLFSDGFGHPRASLTGSTAAEIDPRIAQHFARHLQDSGDPALTPLETFTQACGGSTEQGPFSAADWSSIHPDTLVYEDAAPQVFDSTGGDAANAALTDPISAGNSCRTTIETAETNAASYLLPAATGAGFTLMGSPTVTADIDLGGSDPGFAQIVARLWDSDGQSQSLVTQTLFRPDDLASQTVTFQLHPNGWEFADGHAPKLELLGQSSNYGRPSNGSFDVTVSNLSLLLPVLELPGGLCTAAPAVGCRGSASAGGSKLLIKKGSSSTKDRLVWKYGRGTATTLAELGDPLGATPYAICIYDAASTPLLASAIAAGGTCGNKPCWKAKGSKGYAYSNKSPIVGGIRKLQLKSGTEGKTRHSAKGKGAGLAAPSLPAANLPLTVQLIGDQGLCWEAAFSSPKRNDSSTLKAKSD